MAWLERRAAEFDQQRAIAAQLTQAGRDVGAAMRGIDAATRQARLGAMAAALAQPSAGGGENLLRQEAAAAERLALMLAVAQAAISAIEEATRAVAAMRQAAVTPQCASVTTAFGLASSSTSGTARKKTPAMSSSTSL